VRRDIDSSLKLDIKLICKLLEKLGPVKVSVLAVDDFDMAPMADLIVRDLLAILEDRYDKKATLITSQLSIEQWHDYLGNKTVADDILDLLVHNAHKLNLKGESMRK
jgi:DNA replication protein DnaC